MNKKSIIDEYIDPIFRPTKLVVCKYTTEEQINKLYKTVDGDKIEDLADYDASTIYGVVDKSGKYGVIIVYLNDVIFDKKQYTVPEAINTLAHEALHVAFRISDHNGFSLDYSTNEVFANLVGWATECIYKTYIK